MIYGLKVAFSSKRLEKILLCLLCLWNIILSAVRMEWLNLRHVACVLVEFCIQKAFRLEIRNLVGF